jgi:uncharacterized protein
MKAFLADEIVWHVGGNHEMSGAYRGVDAVLGYFREVRKKTAGTLQVEPEEILANDRHASIFMHVTAHRDVRTLDVLLAEALTLDDRGRWSEYWALANDQDVVDAFMSGDIPRLLQGFADDVVWYAPGDTPVSGTFRGHDGIARFFSGLNEASGGSMNVRADDVLAGDRYVTISSWTSRPSGTTSA